MRVPIKLSSGQWPRWCEAWLPARANPGGLVLADRRARVAGERAAFSAHVSGLLLGGTWRSTAPGRHARTHAAILELPRGERRRILEVGASDGVTALDLLTALDGDIDQFCVTDRSLHVGLARRGERLTFYDRGGLCIAISTRRFIVYPPAGGWPPLSWIARAIWPVAPVSLEGLEMLDLVQPELRRRAREDRRIEIRAHDVFQPWEGEPFDLIKAANLFNLAYFPAERISVALRLLGRALQAGGRLVLTDNRGGQERVTVLRRDGGRFGLERRIHGGAEATGLALGLRLDDEERVENAARGGAPAPVQVAPGDPCDVLIWGRVPPPFGGMAVHVERLLPLLERAGLTVRMANLQRPGLPHARVDEVAGRRLRWYLGLLVRRRTRVHYVLGGRAVTRAGATLLSLLGRGRVVLRVGGESLERTACGRGRAERLLTRFAVRRADAIIAVNPEIGELAVRLGAARERVRVIPGFIAPIDDGSAPPPDVAAFIAGRRPVIVAGGQIAGEGEEDLYGIGPLLEVMPRLLAEHPQAGLVLYAYRIRSRDEAPLARLRARIAELGLAEAMHVHAADGAFWPVLRRADLLLRPTTTDGDSNAIREALHFGVPVVASDCAPRPAGVGVFATGSVEGCLAAMRAAITAKTDAETLGAAAGEGAPSVAAEAGGNGARIVALLQELRR